MIFNVIQLSNGSQVGYNAEVPFSIDKLTNEWILGVDVLNGQTFGFRSDAVVAYTTKAYDPDQLTKQKPKTKKSKGIKTIV